MAPASSKEWTPPHATAGGSLVEEPKYTVTITAEQPPYEYPEGLPLAMTLFSLVLGTFLMALDTTIITVAIPRIATQFNALDQVGWYGSAYLITLTAFQSIAGYVYKSFDPKAVYLVFVVIFEVGSTICASAPLSEVFIFGRAIAGIGAAGLLQGALGIITFICPLDKRPLYMGVVISVFGISCSMGPVLGGVFTDRSTWRWCFWINLPIGLITFILVIASLHLKQISRIPEREMPLKSKLKRIDVIGITFLLGLVACLCIALQDGGNTIPWKSAKVIALLVCFVVLSALFWVTQWKLGENALIPIRFLRQRTVVFASLFLFFDNMANYMMLYYIPFYFQGARGTSAIRSGVDFIALAVPQFVALLLAGGLVTKFGSYMPVILIGQCICAIGTGLLIRLSTTTSTVEWAAFLVLTGVGLGMGINAPHFAIQAVMETDADVFLANGVATFFSQLGGTIAIPIGNTILVNGLGLNTPKFTKGLASSDVIRDGPLGINKSSTSPENIHGVQLAYSEAIQNVMIYTVAIVGASIPVALGMQWLNLKEVSKAREAKKLASASS